MVLLLVQPDQSIGEFPSRVRTRSALTLSLSSGGAASCAGRCFFWEPHVKTRGQPGPVGPTSRPVKCSGF